MKDVLQGLAGQAIALVTFFAFPAIQYLWLKHVSEREGAMNLSFSRVYGFGIAAANQFGRRVFSDLRYRAVVRKVQRSAGNTKLGLCADSEIVRREDFFLFPGHDQIIAAFKLRTTATGVELVPTSVVGEERAPLRLEKGSMLVCDFTANIEMPLNFDYRVSKRAIVDLDQLVGECTASESGALVPRDSKRLAALLSVRSVE